ncbi:MAG TPA: hypothetical protein VGI06_05090 [Acidimicrobiales bacterium]
MRLRNTISHVAIAVGFALAVVGLIILDRSGSTYTGGFWTICGTGLIAAGTVYLLAMDDPQARASALGEKRVVDLRDPAPTVTETPARERVTA